MDLKLKLCLWFLNIFGMDLYHLLSSLDVHSIPQMKQYSVHHHLLHDLEKAVCNNLESFALHCEEYDVTVDWRNDELCRKYIIVIYTGL
jgi:hypothetical protein